MSDNGEYVRRVVAAHTPYAAIPLLQGLVHHQSMKEIEPHIRAWANGHEFEIKLAGSVAKGTAITGTSDMDIFISLHPSVSDCNTLQRVYETLHGRFSLTGHLPRKQNVSVGITHGSLKVDVVAGVRQHPQGFDHSIWKNKVQTWTKTNVDVHVKHIVDSGRALDIRAVKIWRKRKNIDFPSFYLELCVLEALKGKVIAGDPADHFAAVMEFLANDFESKRIVDPANTNNVISEDLTAAEKATIANAARKTLQENWNQALW